MKILTNEICPQCDQRIYITIDAKKDDNDEYIVVDGHGLAANVYLDRDGILCVAPTDIESAMPHYHCILCGWQV